MRKQASLVSSKQHGFGLSFKNLKYEVVDKTKKKKVKGSATTTANKLMLINDVQGFVAPSTTMAIMGPSGAGKTTLLDIISCRRKPTSGEVKINGNLVTEKEMLIHSSYIQQTECIMGTQTVREAIEFCALLKLPTSLSAEEKQGRVDEIIDQLHLKKCANTLVGDPLNPSMRGVSGGERKRCSIGQSLVTDPRMIFLDEPLSGLDAFTAYSVTKSLHELASHSNRTCIMTVHQPSSDVFALFDSLMLLVDGQLVYCGSAKGSIDHFAAAGYRCPAYSNPADFFFMHVLTDADELELMEKRGTRESDTVAESSGAINANGSKEAGDGGGVATDAIVLDGAIGAPTSGSFALEAGMVRQPSFDATERAKELVQFWAKSAAAETLRKQLENHHRSSPEDQLITSNSLNSTERRQLPGFRTQFRILFKRAQGGLLRNPMRAKSLIGQYIAFGIIVALIYHGLGEGQESIQDRVGACFFIATNGMFGSLMPTISTFANERSAFLRERQNGMYSTLAYFVSRSVVEYPLTLVMMCVYTSIIYFSVGFQLEATKYSTFLLMITLETLACSHLGIFFAAVFSRIEVALAILPIIILPLMLFSGFFINSESIPIFLTWIQWLSPIKYAFAGSVQNEFNGLVFTCESEELVRKPTSNLTECRFANGEEFLETLNIHGWLTIEMSMVCLAIIYGIFFMGGYFMLDRMAMRDLN